MSHPIGTKTLGVAEHFGGPVDRIPPWNPKTREHLWSTPALWRVDVARLEAGEDLMFDSATLLSAGVGVGCFYCEQLYEKRLTFRPCPGPTE